MKIISTILFLLLTGYISTAQNTVTIKGTVKGDLKGHTAVYVYGHGIQRDTAYINNGSFELNLPFTNPMFPMIYDEFSQKINGRATPRLLVIDRPGTLYLNDIDIEKGLYNSKISGIKSAVDYDQFYKDRMEADEELKMQLLKKYGDNINSKSPDYQAYRSEFESTKVLKRIEAVQHFVKENPDVFLSSYLFNVNKSYMSLGELEKTYQLLSENIKESEIGKGIADYITGIKKSGIGQVIDDFTLNDANDQPFNFSQLKGKYVVIDFWASWCGPCKASFPHMKELYEKYKSDNFEIYSISIDKSKLDWLTELNKQELPWLQALDTKKLSSTTFAVTGIPTTFLIDPHGKILLKEVGYNTSGESRLERKLIELLGSK